MSSKPASTDDFLTSGLKTQNPTKMHEKCSICKDSWDVSHTSVVQLPYVHDFHRGCIELWITYSVGSQATYPLYRQVLCKKEEALCVDWNDEEDPIFVASLQWVRKQLGTIDSAVRRAWEGNGSDRAYEIGWAEFVIEIFRALRAAVEIGHVTL